MLGFNDKLGFLDECKFHGKLGFDDELRFLSQA